MSTRTIDPRAMSVAHRVSVQKEPGGCWVVHCAFGHWYGFETWADAQEWAVYVHPSPILGCRAYRTWAEEGQAL